MIWSSSSGKIELDIPARLYKQVPTSGPADGVIEKLVFMPVIMKQFIVIPDSLLVETLRGYGAWDDAELTNRLSNLHRLLWIACLDLREGRP
jgi:hypothetical protein